MTTYSAIPSELTERRQWCRWAMSNGRKIPIQPNGKSLKSNDPTTWADYQSVCKHGMIGFVFSNGNPYSGIDNDIADPYTGIDLDNCIAADGTYLAWAQEILDSFRGVAYAEISPSGKGIKLWTRAVKPDGAICKVSFGMHTGIECYDHGRFFAVTGKCIGDGFRTIGDGQAAVTRLCEQHLNGEMPKAEKRTKGDVIQKDDVKEDPTDFASP